jgi:hypothetical protein
MKYLISIHSTSRTENVVKTLHMISSQFLAGCVVLIYCNCCALLNITTFIQLTVHSRIYKGCCFYYIPVKARVLESGFCTALTF